ncbi:mitotic checkpoint serine/threonine-protein kinase BUB1 beta-like isoform X3 [Sinocyclocheilus grahami]|uniref:mitotic checkpoint serine/threonine-protein kinase BUB1 beta-like isoform X3 n=1 Tax=Sinocyclocheilus grahami TaxID=75366 RepID=UPI0007AC64BF|nr:PREDICTED: mitotic checkpoint serine/threonine-protein kinase BUB1 beta-like isoform X3 [Sinocyclocheilus grahami]
MTFGAQVTSLRMSLELEKLSTHHNWSAPGVPSQTGQVQEEHESQQEGHVQIMYCKDQVYQEDAEFSFEELRAQRHYKSLSERASHLQKLKQDLQCQIEEKQRLIQQRDSTAEKQQVVHEEASSSFQKSAGSCESDAAVVKSAPFTVCSEQEEDRVVSSGSSVRREDDMNHSGSDAKLQKTAKPFTVFDENTLTNKTSSSANRNSLKLPTLSLKVPKSKAELVTDKDASISRSEEAIINSHRNKTLCRSPEDTCEFARAAQLASSPFAGVERTKASESGLMENLSRTAPESTKAPSSNASAEEKKLSPILEISQEWGGTFSHNSMKRLKEPEISRAADTPEEAVTESEDVCGLSVRSRLFHQADVTSFSNFQRKTGRLPDTSGDDLCLDGEVLVYCGKMETLKDFTLYCSDTAAVFLKVDWSGVPWDFFIRSQLRSRRSRDEPDADVQICCYVFENGCMTLWRIPHGDTLQDLLAEPSAADDVSLLVVLLLELVKQFHSCRVVHGGLKPESLYFYLSGITALDFSNSVDLQLQTDVTTAQALPSAQKYIQQGLLSPSASPYQVDLIGVAEVVHMLLFNRPMKVKQENSAWSLDEGSGSQHSVPVEPLWKDFFRMILNPEQKSSELVLSELISNVRNSL